MNEHGELISVVTICYNADKTIRKTLESVLNQTYRPLEYVIKDGSSTDGTQKMIQSYIGKLTDAGISVRYISAPDHGIYDAMNEATALCTGKWINYMNADDCFYQASSISDVFEKKGGADCDVLFGDTLMCDEESNNLRYSSMELIGQKMPFIHQSAFFKRDVLGKRPYEESYAIAADYDMICRLYQSNRVFEYVPVIVAKYSIDGLSSKHVRTSIRERQQVRLKYGFADSRNCPLFVKERAAAAVQSLLLRYCPQGPLRYIKRFYKKYIRKYKQVEKDGGREA